LAYIKLYFVLLTFPILLRFITCQYTKKPRTVSAGGQLVLFKDYFYQKGSNTGWLHFCAGTKI